MFYAEWCHYCSRFRPLFAEAAKKSRYVFAAIDISDEENPLWERLGIDAVPTMILYRTGKIADRITGGLEKNELDAFIKKNGIT